jgi:putative membrane protein
MVAYWPSMGNFLIYLGVSLPLLAVGMIVFRATTPYDEYSLLKLGGNAPEAGVSGAAQAVAYDLGGKLLGMAVVLASAIYHAVSVWDLLTWGVIGMIFQVLVFYLFALLMPFKVLEEIPRGNTAIGILSSRISLATGLLMAALISY